MTDIKVTSLSVPRIPRNKRIYSEYKSERISIGAPASDNDIVRVVQANLLSYDAGDFLTRTVDVEFNTFFIQRPIGDVRAYRYDARNGGGYFYSNVVFHVEDENWLQEDGFRIIIEDYEDLNGVFIEYNFTERDGSED